MKGKDNTVSNLLLVARGRPYVKKNNETCVRFWTCGKIEHVKYKYPDGAASEKSIESNANNVSLVVGGDDLL